MMLKARHLKRLDRYLGQGFARLLPTPGRTDEIDVRNVLFIRPGGLGDVLLLLPTITLLKQVYPGSQIDVLAESRNRGGLMLCPHIHGIYRYDHFPDMVNLFLKRYDVVIDTEQWYRLSAVVARLVRSNWKIGFATNERQRMLTHPVDYLMRDYEVFNFFRLLEPLGIQAPDQCPDRFLSVPSSAKESVNRLLSGYPYEKLVVIFPFASIPERRWGWANFRKVAEWCLTKDVGVVIVGGQEDREESLLIAQGLEVCNLVWELRVVETAELMDRSSAVVSGDSGPLHIAVGVGAQTVSLFGPGIEEKWAPRGDMHKVINMHLECSPCTAYGVTPPCPIGVQCMHKIEVKEVTRALVTLLPES